MSTACEGNKYHCTNYIIFQQLNVTSHQFYKNKKIFKKKGEDQIVLSSHVPPPNPTPYHSFSSTSLLSFGRLSLFFLSFSFFSLYLNTHTLTSTLTRRPPLQTTPSHHHFSGKITGKILRNPKTFIILFEVKFLISFDGYYVLV